ncbi:MAG: glycosyltransferase [Lachnospiraceae bacterium]|nr:glycosyltransferase [Lachnospiraceae bacterium]
MLKTLQSIFTNKADKDVKFMKPFFSILVPIYNVEPYLTKCLDSLIHQTFTDIQIICINDGSTDRCQEILEEYSKKDSRIRIINQRNNGYGAALNRGLTYVKADYISIIEPDDYLKLDAYEKFFCDILQNPNIDIIKYAYWQFRDIDGVKKIEPSASSKLSLPEIPFQITQYPQLLLYHPSIWSCVYKTTFIQKHNLCFIEAPGLVGQIIRFLLLLCV